MITIVLSKRLPRFRFYVLLLTVLLSFSCDYKTSVENSTNKQTNDSIFAWIKQGRNTDISNAKRLEHLLKAHEFAYRTSDDTLKPKYFSKLSLAYLKLGDSIRFRTANKETTAFALMVGDSVSYAETHWDLGTFFRNKAVADSAYHHFVKAQKIYNALQNQDYAGRMLYNMAHIQFNVKDYTGSEINTVKAIELLKPLESNLEIYRGYNLLGNITQNFKEYDRALQYYNVALEYLNKLEDTQGLEQELLNNIGYTYQKQDQHQKAVSYFNQVLNTKGLKRQNAKLYAISLDNLTTSQLKLNDTLGIGSRINEALAIRDSIEDVAGVSESHHTLAEYHLINNDTAQAKHEALQAKVFAKLSSNNFGLLESLQFLARLDTKNTLAHTNEYISLNDSLLQEERKARNKFTRIRFETDEFIAENEELTRKKQIWTGVAIGLFLLGGLLYIIVSQRTKNQKLQFQQKQQASNQEIFNLMLSQKEKLEEGKQMEQKRISEELHDGVLGKMLGARMVLTGLNKKTDEEATRERAIAITVLKDIEGEVRSISHELNHAAYQKIHNFISSIEELLKDVCPANSIEYNFTYNETLDWDALDGDIKINLYRMVQECLQNSVKHAECKNVMVDFKKEDDHLNIQIADDGKGITRVKKKKGIGTRNISSRIEKLGGSWKFDSTPGQGTKVVLNIPIVYYTDDLPLNENARLIEA